MGRHDHISILEKITFPAKEEPEQEGEAQGFPLLVTVRGLLKVTLRLSFTDGRALRSAFLHLLLTHKQSARREGKGPFSSFVDTSELRANSPQARTNQAWSPESSDFSSHRNLLTGCLLTSLCPCLVLGKGQSQVCRGLPQPLPCPCWLPPLPLPRLLTLAGIPPTCLGPAHSTAAAI